MHARVTANRWLQAFAWLKRIVLFLAFLPSGVKKIAGEPFTILGPETSVGYLFDGYILRSLSEPRNGPVIV